MEKIGMAPKNDVSSIESLSISEASQEIDFQQNAENQRKDTPYSKVVKKKIRLHLTWI